MARDSINGGFDSITEVPVDAALYRRVALREQPRVTWTDPSGTHDLLLTERVNEADGFRHVAPGFGESAPARGREKWVINKLRALNSWYTKGLTGGSQLRVAINSVESISQLKSTISEFFVINPKTVDVEDHRPLAVLPE